MNFNDEIRRNRFHDFTVRLGGSRGALVRQMSHEFLFGSNAFGLVRGVEPEKLEAYQQAVKRLWNSATMPFYWGRYEPEEGRPDERAVMAASAWCRNQGLIVKGHPLCWHTVCADWLLKYDNDAILHKQLERIRRDVGRYAGVIDMWDVINEVVIMPVFDKYDNAVTRICNHVGAIELTLLCFRTARETNPDAVLLINDFDLSPRYEELVERLLEKGCPIDAIGLQSHQHQGYHGAEYTLRVIERFSRFGLPLHFTEATIISGHPMPAHIVDLNDYKVDEWPSTSEGEELQLRQVEEYYSAVFSQPSTAALVWWDMRDGGWLGAPAGLFRRDLTPKPAFRRLEELIKGEWWFREQDLPAAADGALHFRGPSGTYEITTPDGRRRELVLNRANPVVDAGGAGS